jgi:predicted YcjX-like family ATPase
LDQPPDDIWTQIRRGWRDTQRQTAAALHAAVNTATIRIAVTGLSRAGKTVFITSAVQNLLAMADGKGALPKFDDHGISTRLKKLGLASPTDGAARFPFERNFAALAGESPHWPPRTAGLAEIALKFIVRRQRTAGLSFLKEREITVEILDYPGEWLLDLPMLSQDFATWSAETLERMGKGLRAAPAKPFLEAMSAIDLDSPADPDTARRLHDLYLAFLFEARDRHGLRYLQPGGFLCNPPWPRTEALIFAPLPAGRKSPVAGSYRDLFQKRFDLYRTEMGTRFFDRHFSRFERQIVLVDVLGALHGGPDVFEDTRLAISRLADCYTYGGRSLINPFARGITKVVFAATKADHVPERQRDALQILLGRMAGAQIDDIRDNRATVRTAAIASVRCTLDDRATIEGRDVAVVRGLPMGRDKLVQFYPGEVPLKPPGADFWSGSYFEMPVFQPPRLDPSGLSGVPHIALDDVLFTLLGDRL